jgi:prepilin-type N-terminal cleavage/methylation domain-containing protein
VLAGWVLFLVQRGDMKNLPINPHAALRQKGLTLVELLATMVLMALIMGLMVTAMGQVSQVLRVSNELDAGFLPKWRQSRLFVELIENLALDPKDDRAFVGKPEIATFRSFASPFGEPGIAGGLQLELVDDAQQADVALLQLSPVKPASFGQVAPERLNLGRFNGRMALRYVDSAYVEHAQWPPFGATDEHVLPSAVIVRDRFGQQEAYLVASYAGPTMRQGNGLSQIFSGAR